MTQFIRPDSNITQTSFTNGFAAIDETTASDADFAYGANNTASTLEVGLSNPLNPTYIDGTCTVRYRIARTNAGVLDGGGNDVTVTTSVRQGATQLAADSAKSTTGTWTTYTFTFAASLVTDNNWTDLRLRFVTSASGGAPASRRGAGISWAEIEVPDAAATRYVFTT